MFFLACAFTFAVGYCGADLVLDWWSNRDV